TFFTAPSSINASLRCGMLTRTLRWCWIFRTAAGLGPVLCAPERRAPLAIRNRTAISRTAFRLPLWVLMAAGIVFSWLRCRLRQERKQMDRQKVLALESAT